jgi:hypothetical protein
LSNIVEKALGSVAKSGTSAIAAVAAPGERVTYRTRRIHGPLTRLVTILCEKSGLALLVLSTNDWTRLRRIKDRILMAVESIQPSTRVEFEVPKSE